MQPAAAHLIRVYLGEQPPHAGKQKCSSANDQTLPEGMTHDVHATARLRMLRDDCPWKIGRELEAL